jgi:uridine kinase
MSAPPFLVGIAGGSGSGKSALAHRIAAALGDRAAILAHDAYYLDRPGATDGDDFDTPEALDGARFLADLRALRAGRPVCPPRYCFETHRRLGDGPRLEPRAVVLVEGILLLHDRAVRGVLDLAIFVDAPGTLRLARRVARDTRERGRTAESVARQYAATVSPAHARYVEPTKALADLVLLNAGRLEPLVEVATTVIRARLARRDAEPIGADPAAA